MAEMKLNQVVTHVAERVREFFSPTDAPNDPAAPRVDVMVPPRRSREALEDDARMGWVDVMDPTQTPRDLYSGRALGRGRRSRGSSWARRWERDG